MKKSAHAWQKINWQGILHEVRRVQAAIVQAERAGNQREVIRLQDQLVRSRTAKLLAVRQVTTNSGKRTPGVDTEIWSTPQQKMQAVERLNSEGYHPQPAKRVCIPKDENRMRPLGILTMRDRAIQALYLFGLDPIAETRADPHSYGFRKYRSTADAIAYCAEIFRQKDSPLWILDADIEECFDTIDHTWLLQHIPLEKTILRRWLQAGYVEHGKLHKTTRGLPQGGILSPALANMALDGMEEMLVTYFHQSPRRRKQSKIRFVRYADDFIVAGAGKGMLEQEVKPLLENFLKARGMRFSAQKTTLTPLKQGFNFLGYHLIRNTSLFGNPSLTLTPAAKSVTHVLKTLRNTVQSQQGANATQLIEQMNRIISGWARHYRCVDSHEHFARLDDEAYQMLWEWAKHRHPRTWNRRLKRMYFTRVRGQTPVFSDHQGHTLFCARDTPVTGYVPIDPNCNAYDPKWQPYLTQRQKTTTN